MKRLGYLKLLYRQAETQSYAPPPLNFSAILLFHDIMEYYFLVAVSHLGNPQGLNLREPFSANVKRLLAPDGQKLSGLDGVHRVALGRDAFKHNGIIPSTEQIEEGRRDLALFVDLNCSRVFGVAFAEISMLLLVPQEEVRNHLLLARKSADDQDIRTAMGELAIAFYKLMKDWGTGKSIQNHGSRTKNFYLNDEWTHRRRNLRYSGGSDRSTDQFASGVRETVEDIDKELDTLRRAIRIQMTGIDMAKYVYFSMIAPEISIGFATEKIDVFHGSGEFHYTAENYERCEQFLMESALRLAEADFKLWMPSTYGDFDRARQAMEANGGRLPDGWE